MKELARENWNYILFEKEGSFVIEVECGGVAMYTKTHILTTEEAKRYFNEGMNYLKLLAEELRNKR